MVNKVTIIGKMGNDPQYKELPSNLPICNISLVMHKRAYKNADGKYVKPSVEFLDVVAFGNVAKNISKAVKKGDIVYIDAELKQKVNERDGFRYRTINIIAKNFEVITKPNNNTTSVEEAVSNLNDVTDDFLSGLF